MSDFPHSLIEFQSRFPDEAACVEYLFAARWPEGFVCPACGGGKAWPLQTKAWTWECADCSKQTSVTEGSMMLHSKLQLTCASGRYLMATIPTASALQLQRQIGLGSYKSACLLCAKMRRSMVAATAAPWPGSRRRRTEIVCRTRRSPTGGGAAIRARYSWSAPSRLQTAGPTRPRPPTFDYSQSASFLKANLAQAPPRGPTLGGYPCSWRHARASCRRPHGRHIVLPGPTASSPTSSVGAGVYHGLRRKHLQTYLDEFVFRFNRRRADTPPSARSSASPRRIHPSATKC